MSDRNTETSVLRLSVLLGIAGTAALIGIVYLWGTLNIHVPRLADPVGPRAFPLLVGVGMLAAAAVMVIEHLQGERRGGQEDAPEPAAYSWVVGGIFAWTLLYISVFEWLGYVASTFIYVTGLMIYFSRGRLVLNLVIGLLFCVFSYLLLAVLLHAQLPPGELFRNLLF
jgi:putative tricarboxylic transport membrane protein